MIHPQAIILPYKGILPKIDPTAFIAAGAVIIGDVEIGAQSSVWPNCVIRGDVNIIRIGSRTNIQDGTVIHVTRPSIATHNKQSGQTIIGDNITIGHKAMLHACTLESECFVGMSATIMDGAIVRKNGWVAGGAVVNPKKEVPTGEIWAGNPAKHLRPLTADELNFILKSAANYVGDMAEYVS
jgi:carbonic anhydrase/acetyltransferase-like protein (isoleucine patch superfamily)